MGDLNLVTIAIIAANILISFKGFKDPYFFEKYKFNVGAIQRGEKIRFLSSGFLHVDTAHLFLNMLTLYFFADVVISMLGTLGFTLIYLASLIIGNLLSYFFHRWCQWRGFGNNLCRNPAVPEYEFVSILYSHPHSRLPVWGRLSFLFHLWNEAAAGEYRSRCPFWGSSRGIFAYSATCALGLQGTFADGPTSGPAHPASFHPSAGRETIMALKFISL